jgi:hypothetical protein
MLPIIPRRRRSRLPIPHRKGGGHRARIMALCGAGLVAATAAGALLRIGRHGVADEAGEA